MKIIFWKKLFLASQNIGAVKQNGLQAILVEKESVF